MYESPNARGHTHAHKRAQRHTHIHTQGQYLHTLLALTMGAWSLIMYAALVVLQLRPIWEAQHFIPVLGMLLVGSCLSIVIYISFYYVHVQNTGPPAIHPCGMLLVGGCINICDDISF